MKRVAIAAGGTGGHIFPAMALAEAIRSRHPGCEILFFGNDNRMEAGLIPEAGYPFFGLHAAGLAGSPADKAKAVLLQLSAFRKARRKLKAFKPDLVAGFGGYVSTPVLFAAKSLGIPVLVHEQNSIAGKANKLLKHAADRFITCYKEAGLAFPPEKVRQLGNPRGSLALQAKGDRAYFDSLGLDPEKAVILVMMGSLGSSSVNQLLQQALAQPVEGLQFLFVTGKDNEQDLRLFADRPDIVTVPFVDTLKIYPYISGMVCRAGATTLSELTALGIPAILIPSPYVAENHQYHNAKALEQAHAAWLLEEKDFKQDPGKLRRLLMDCLSDEDKRTAASRAAKTLGKPNAAVDIVREMEELIHEAG